MKKKFRRHFRIYFKNNHPAYIVDEEGELYVFHRVTHSKTSGGKKNWAKPNPLLNDDGRTMYIVKKEQRDKKTKFSVFEIKLKKDVDVSFPEIKKVGTNVQPITGSHQARSRSRYESSTTIKSKRRKKRKKKK